MGARFPSGLSILGARHAGASRRHSCAANPLFTATAKPGVIQDIRDYFRSRLGIELDCVDGGALRTDLNFEVRAMSRHRKLQDIADIISRRLSSDGRSGAIVYCATRNATERVAEFLRDRDLRRHTSMRASRQMRNAMCRSGFDPAICA